MSRSSLFTYEGLPKKSGGMHALKAKSSSASWTKMRCFLDECFLVPEPLTARLDVKRQHDLSDMDPIVDRFVRAFGSPISGTSKVATHLNWFLDNAQLNEVLSIIDSLPETFVDEYGRQLVYVLVKANQPKLKDSQNGMLPNQGGNQYLGFEGEHNRILGESYFDAQLGKKNFVYAFLSLPFEQADAEFREYAEYLRGNFPCPMSNRTWKRWTLTKSGKSYVGRKVKPESVFGSAL